MKPTRKTSKLSERSIVLCKRLELLKAREGSASTLILVENGSIFCFCVTIKIANVNFVLSRAKNFRKRQKVVHKQWCKKYSKNVIN